MLNFLSKVRGVRSQPDEQDVPATSASRTLKKDSSVSYSTKTHITSKYQETDIVPVLLLNAAQLLSDCIQEILSNTSCLSGDNISGFERLLQLLDSTIYAKDPLEISRSNGIGCLQVLVDNLYHKKFSEICNQVSLGTALMQALRLIRMYEIKCGKSNLPDAILLPSNVPISKTFNASLRVSKVFIAMCSDVLTTEELRPILVKLFTFPLSVLPPSGVHIQEHSANIVSAICKMGFTSQQVWFLHDVQVINHMIRHLSELTVIDKTAFSDASAATEKQSVASSNPDSSVLLKGIASERAGMWYLGTRCLVDVITASVSVSAVLMSDFNICGGPAVLTHVLEHCAPERFMRCVNVITRLLYDQHKSSGDAATAVMPFPAIGAILHEVLRSALKTIAGVQSDANMKAMIDISVIIYSQEIDHSIMKEYVLQSMAYALLTLYSNDPQHCLVLEQNYHFLPMLIVALPAMSNFDAISAVLTTLNFVCQCVESAAMLPLMALCSATAVVFSIAAAPEEWQVNGLTDVRRDDDDDDGHSGRDNAVEGATAVGSGICLLDAAAPSPPSTSKANQQRKRALLQLDLLLVSIDTVVRNTPSCIDHLLNAQIIVHLFRDPLEQLCTALSSSEIIDAESISAYTKLIDLMISFNSKSAAVAREIHEINFPLLARCLLSSRSISASFSEQILKLPVELAKLNTVYLEDVFDTIVAVLVAVDDDFEKIGKLLDTLTKLVLCCGLDAGMLLLTNYNGIKILVSVLGLMNGKFRNIRRSSTATSSPSDKSPSFLPEKPDKSPLWLCLESCMRLLSVLFEYETRFFSKTESISTLMSSTEVYRVLADQLLRSLIFSSNYASHAVQLLFEVLVGFQHDSKHIVNVGAVRILVYLFPHLERNVTENIVSELHLLAAVNSSNMKKIALVGIVRDLIQLYSSVLSDKSLSIDHPIPKLIKSVSCNYLTSDAVSALLQFIIRPTVVVGGGGGGDAASSFKMLLPWQSSCVSSSDHSQRCSDLSMCLQLLSALVTAENVSLHGWGMSPPFIALGPLRSAFPNDCSASSPCIVATMSDATKPFPATAFSFSCWIQISSLDAVSNEAFFRNIVPLFSFGISPSEEGSRSGGGGTDHSASSAAAAVCHFEAHWDTENAFVRIVAMRSNRQTATLRFRLPRSVNTENWNCFVITLRKPKRFTSSSRAAIAVFINGLTCMPVNSESIDVDMTFANQRVDVMCGKFWMDFSNLSSDVLPGDSSLKVIKLESPLAYNIGPLYLFDEAMSSEQAAFLFTKGPASTSSHLNAHAPLAGSVAALSAQLMTISVQYGPQSKSASVVADFLEEIGLRGLELVVEPSQSDHHAAAMASSSSSTTAVDVAPTAEQPPRSVRLMACSLPQAVLSFHGANGRSDPMSSPASRNALQSSATSKDLLSWQVHYDRIYLYNSSSIDYQQPVARLDNCHFVSNSSSFGQCVAALGGPDVLLPALQAASDAQQVSALLTLLSQAVRYELSNRKYMQSVGFKIVAFLLSIKSKDVITVEVVDALFLLAVERSGGGGGARSVVSASMPSAAHTTDSSASLLLVDSAAMHFLMLNPLVWGGPHNRYSEVCHLLGLLARLATDEQHGVLNAKRLTLLDAARWTVLMLAHGILAAPQPAQTGGGESSGSSRSDSTSSPNPPLKGLENSSSWQFSRITATELAEYRDEKDGMLFDAMQTVQRCLFVATKKKDLDLLMRVILYSLIPKQTENPTFRRASSGDCSVEYEHDSVRYPFCSYASASSEEDGSAGPVSAAAATTNINLVPLAPAALLRVYLLRMLFNVYDHFCEELRQRQQQQVSAGRRRGSIADASGAGGLGGSSSSSSQTQMMRRYLDAASVDAFFVAFRTTFSASWFMGVLERSTEIATIAQLLRLLALLLQHDLTFQREFLLGDGFKVLYTSLSVRSLSLPVTLPLLAILFRIPIQLLPHPCQIRSVNKLCTILDLEECHLGPDISELAITEPLLCLLLDGIVFTYRERVALGQSSGDAGSEDLQNHSSKVMDVVFGMVNYGMERLSACKQLFQLKGSIDVIVVALLNTSNAFADYDNSVGCAAGGDENASQSGLDLTSSIQEDYISPVTGLLSRPNSNVGIRSSFSDSFGGLAYDTQHAAGMVINDGRRYQERMDLQFPGSISSKFIDIVSLSFQQAVYDYDGGGSSCAILYNYFSAFPRNMSSGFEHAYQKLILDQFSDIVRACLTRAYDANVVASLSNIVTYSLGLVRSNFLYDTVVFALFKLTYDILATLLILPATFSIVSNNERLVSNIKEFGSAARVLAMASMATFQSFHEKNGSLHALEVFSTVRSAMRGLLHGALDDSAVDCAAPSPVGAGLVPSVAASGVFPVASRILRYHRNASGNTDEYAVGGGGLMSPAEQQQQHRTMSTAASTVAAGALFAAAGGASLIADALQEFASSGGGGGSSGRRLAVGATAGVPPPPTISYMKAERNRVSVMFSMSMANSCYSLILEDDTALRREATRILALLTTQRRALMEHLFSNVAPVQQRGLWKSGGSSSNNGVITDEALSAANDPASAAAAVDVFKDGLLKLVPNGSGKYEQFLKSANNEQDSEENRFADFSFWVADNSYKCDKVFNSIDTMLQGLQLSTMEIEDMIRQAVGVRVRDILLLSSASSVVRAMQRAEQGQRLGEQVAAWMRRWALKGFSSLAAGAQLWKTVWNTQQAGPIWGYAAPGPEMCASPGSVADRKHSSSRSSSSSDDSQFPQCQCNCCCYSVLRLPSENTEEPMPSSSIAVDRGLTTQYWALNEAHGPERARKCIQQDFRVLTESAFSQTAKEAAKKKAFLALSIGAAATSAALQLQNSETLSSTGGGTTSAAPSALDTKLDDFSEKEDMVNFVQKVTKRGLIRRVSAINSSFDPAGDRDDDFATTFATGADLSAACDSTDLVERGIDDGGRRDLTAASRLKRELDEVVVIDEDIDDDDEEELGEEGEEDKENGVSAGGGVVENEHEVGGSNPLQLVRDQLALTSKLVEDRRAFSIGAENDGESVSADARKSISSRHRGTSMENAVDSGLSPMTITTSTGGGGVGSNISTARHRLLMQSDMLQEVVKGLIGATEWARGHVHNIRRISGLEAEEGILVITAKNIHIISGIRYTKNFRRGVNSNVVAGGGGITSTAAAASHIDALLEWKPLDEDDTLFHTNKAEAAAAATARKRAMDAPGSALQSWWVEQVWAELLGVDVGYCAVPLDEINSFFKRRHQLMYTALEIFGINGVSILFACETVAECDDILLKLLEADLPSSMFSRVMGLKNLQMLRGVSHVYSRLMSLFISTITQAWQQGELSNFEYLIHINAAAGRSFQDLTQYPVFPWILADYTSEKLDLTNPQTFRDLTKPMGALGARRAAQYRDRYTTMDEFLSEGVEGSAPPFFYGTHYSCAGYVLHYLLRLQPYASMNVALQGGKFDTADRLFLSIENSWLSASQENLQDVRELIPEFFCLPEFLSNVNKFDFGKTQKNEIVDDVRLPRWAHGDAREFVRLHREALECRYVSENLHHWIDLVFGFKQQGPAAVEAKNVFIHLTYEGEVDVAAIADPLARSATISQINNFGQTPSRIFTKPHPRKIIPEVVRRLNDLVLVDQVALQWHAHMCPPLCVAGAPQYNLLTKVFYGQVGAPSSGSGRSASGGPVRDLCLVRDKIVACCCAGGGGGVIVPPSMRLCLRFGRGVGLGSICLQPLATLGLGNSRSSDTEKELTYQEGLHNKRITCVSISRYGDVFATGSDDASVRVWSWAKPHQIQSGQQQQHYQGGGAVHGDVGGSKIAHVCTLVGHVAGTSIRCIELAAEFALVVSGDSSGGVCVWNYRTKRLVRTLCQHSAPLQSVSVNALGGYISTLTAEHLRLFTVNGDLLAAERMHYSSEEQRGGGGGSGASSMQQRYSRRNGMTRNEVDDDEYGGISSSSPSGGGGGDSVGESSSSGAADGARLCSPVAGPSVVLSPPAMDWQDGVIAITGHKSGLVHLWKLRQLATSDIAAAQTQKVWRSGGCDSSAAASSSSSRPPPGAQQEDHHRRPLRKLYIACSLPQIHRAEITSLRLSSSILLKATKDVVSKAFEDSRSLDLIVGDSAGYASRWATMKLDQLPNTDLQAIITMQTDELH